MASYPSDDYVVNVDGTHLRNITHDRASNGAVDWMPDGTLSVERSLLGFVLRRAAALVLLAIGITLVVFVLTQLVPSNAVATNLGEQAAGDPAAVAAGGRARHARWTAAMIGAKGGSDGRRDASP